MMQLEGKSLYEFMGKVEANLILNALSEAKGNLSQAARILGVQRTTLRAKIIRYFGRLPITNG